MNKFNVFIGKRNFKRIFIIYMIAAITAGAACLGTVGYIYRDKIRLAAVYEKTSAVFKKQGDSEKFRQSLAELADSADITDILLLDNRNNIVYSAKNTDIAGDTVFDLNRAEDGSRFLVTDKNSGAAFRLVKSDEFMLTSVFADDFTEIHDEYCEDNFYRSDFQNRHLYFISLLNKNPGDIKAYVISDPISVPYGMLLLKIAASILMLLFMLYWIIVAMWVYQNAEKARLNAPAWGIITLFTNLAGVFVYAVYKHISGVCTVCGAAQNRGNVFCTVCGSKIGATCTECGHSLKTGDEFCPKCGHKRG